MHYAEFAENEVLSHAHTSKPEPPRRTLLTLDLNTERCVVDRYKRIREQQVEGHWCQGQQTGQGL